MRQLSCQLKHNYCWTYLNQKHKIAFKKSIILFNYKKKFLKEISFIMLEPQSGLYFSVNVTKLKHFKIYNLLKINRLKIIKKMK